SERNGKVVGVRIVSNDDDLMIITGGGKLIRMPIGGIPVVGRNTQGVRLIRLEESEKVVAVESFAEAEGEHVADPAVVSEHEVGAPEEIGDEDTSDGDAGEEE